MCTKRKIYCMNVLQSTVLGLLSQRLLMQLCCWPWSGYKQTKRCLLKSKSDALFGGSYLNNVVTRAQLQGHRYWNGHTMVSHHQYFHQVPVTVKGFWINLLLIEKYSFETAWYRETWFEYILSMCLPVELDAGFSSYDKLHGTSPQLLGGEWRVIMYNGVQALRT